MNRCGQLRALLKKNLILMKRSCCATVCEIIFPMILMILLVLIRRAVKIEDVTIDQKVEDQFFYNYSTSIINPIQSNITSWNNLKVRNPFSICNKRKNIGVIGSDQKLKEISDIIKSYNDKLEFKAFQSIEDVNKYISSTEYDSDPNIAKLCFAYSFRDYGNNKFNYSLHYFDVKFNGGLRDIPSNLDKSLDFFQTTPNLDDYERWLNSGYLQMMKIINDVILRSVVGDNNASIEFGMIPYKFSTYSKDRLGNLIAGFSPFFIIIAYIFPLCLLVFRMVREKETRAKEGMKIMGLNETIYFMSFFIQFSVLNSIYAVLNSLILTQLFKYVGFLYILGFFWLYGMTVFAMGYFFQSLMDKTRIAMILSILIYFIMYFVSVAVISEEVENPAKMLISLLPPTCLQLGVQVLGKFETSRIKFSNTYINYKFNNFSVGDMYLMFFIDIIIYLFLGYYFNNVIHHQFGIKKPFYFLCTKSFWCKKKKIYEESIRKSSEQIAINIDTINKNNFQSEKAYDDIIKKGDYLKISDLKKTFDDGKIAVDGLSLNLYKDEIFALLGHNGAGKSTTISILCGLYESTSGKAYYGGDEIFENMSSFRKKVGICPQHDVLFDNLNIREHLEMFCIFKGVPSKRIKQEVDHIIQEMGLNDKEKTLAKNLSGGQKRKLSISLALVGGSEVVFLDEPSSGMDITSRRNLWDILKRCTTNRIIVLTTHYMEEAAVLGKRIGILSSGKLKCCGSSLFLIDRFGKYISLSVLKNKDADDNQIIEFMKQNIPNLKEPELLSEEIIFRIPMNSEHGCKNFFHELDKNLDFLKIKSYGASMPTLEDVFLNVSAEVDQNLKNDIIDKEHEDLNSYDKYDSKSEAKPSSCHKFIIDLKSSVKRRILQIIRDKKTFILEVLCPILLVLIGLGVSSVQFVKNSPSNQIKINLLNTPTTIYINNDDTIFKKSDSINYKLLDKYNDSNKSILSNLIGYNTEILPKSIMIPEIDSFGSFYLLKSDSTNHKYQFITLANTQSKDSAIIYPHVLMNNIISSALGKEVIIDFFNYPFPLTERIKTQGQTRNYGNLVFFVSIAFSLIPANFITILIKEREFNTKHLQIVSGISYTSYWTSNFIFELFKYYFTGGICLLLILAFDNFPNYFWILYLLYGFSMVSFTYCLTFVFKNESYAQNFVILVNFIFGALGGTVIIILRVFDDLKKFATPIAYILRVIPSFAFAYGYNQLLNTQLLFFVDNFITLDIISFEYVGSDFIYLGATFGFFMLVLILSEFLFNKVQFGNKDNKPDYEKVTDVEVRKEIEKSNMLSEGDKDINYSIRVQNLEKLFSTGCCKSFKAVDKLSFCLEYGECFALLGVNGAGKTTTFKCLTNEIYPSKGKIFIDSMNVADNFNNVRNLIGYCPQFDAIFDYLTVKENLEFYANIRGIPSSKIDYIIESLMKEMNLTQYRDKISGNLSGGNKRKLSVGISMIGNPPIILLDEPSTGMDPEARRFMWAVIHKISKTRKKSSVILTTHSMEEAETLCRRMGIMVAGQFKCLGTSQQIKDKYGYGYEIDIGIMHMPEEMWNQFSTLQLNENINLENIQMYLDKINKSKFIELIQPKKLGREIYEELVNKRPYTLKKLIDWSFYVQNILLCISKLLNVFNEIVINEFWENNFKLKIKKNINNPITIGYLFGIFEDQKKVNYISEYSISQTSMEQIFNNFARGGENIDNNEIVVNNEMLNLLEIKI